MFKINKNFIKRKIYKLLPRSTRLQLASNLLPEVKPSLENFIFRPAETPEDYLSAFNLVYKVFLKTGFIQPSPTPFRLAPQHSHKDSRVFIGVNKENNKEKVVYSISIFPDSDAGLPMDTVFSKELEKLRAKGRFIVEAGHLAADSTYKMNTMNVPMLGNKILHQYTSEYLDADDIVIAIHPKYRWFYEELLLFEKIGEIGEYSYANNNPAVAMRLDLRTAQARYKKVYRKISKEKNFYHFFFIQDSDSIVLTDEHLGIGKRLLDNIKCIYGIKP